MKLGKSEEDKKSWRGLGRLTKATETNADGISIASSRWSQCGMSRPAAAAANNGAAGAKLGRRRALFGPAGRESAAAVSSFGVPFGETADTSRQKNCGRILSIRNRDDVSLGSLSFFERFGGFFVCLFVVVFLRNRKPPRHFSTGRALLCKTVGHCEGETIRKFFGQGKPTNLANPFWRNASEFMDKQRDAGTPKPISVSSPPSTDPIVQVKICSTKHENAIKMTIL